jgi:6-phosphogluconolactonase
MFAGVMKLCCWYILAFVVSTVMSTSAATPSRSARVYIGTYTEQKSKGIYVSQFDAGSGQLSNPELAAECKSPSFLAIHPNGRWLYAVNETENFEGKKSGSVAAFAIDENTGTLQLLNQQSSEGTGPCHVSLDHAGKCVMVANYGSGSVAVYQIEKDGKLAKAGSAIQHHGSSVNHQRQEGPHAHFITPDASDKFALACDLGLDKVMIYELNGPKAQLAAHQPHSAPVPAGAGPRHLVFHPSNRFAYVINEMGSSITAFDWNARRGEFKQRLTVSTLPTNYKGDSSCAEIQMHPSGNFVCGSNRGDDSIAVFSVDPKTGRLSLVEHASTEGKTPRHFTFDPSGKWLLAENQNSDDIVVLQFNPESGHLTSTKNKIQVGAPVCAVFAPSK